MNPSMMQMGEYQSAFGRQQQQGWLYKETTLYDKMHPKKMNNYLTNAEIIRGKLQNMTRKYKEYHPSNKDNAAEKQKQKDMFMETDAQAYKDKLQNDIKFMKD
eukprot:718668_1